MSVIRTGEPSFRGDHVMLTMEEKLREISRFEENISFLPTGIPDDDEVSAKPGMDYQFWTDIWVGIVLTLMVLSCVCCMCSCVLYHKFQQWKMSAVQPHNQVDLEFGTIEAELPSYTIASGLPTYQEALEQLKKVKELTKNQQKITNENNEESSRTTPTPLSVVTLFQLYNKSSGLIKSS